MKGSGMGLVGGGVAAYWTERQMEVEESRGGTCCPMEGSLLAAG
jgi:hypothetical protein